MSAVDALKLAGAPGSLRFLAIGCVAALAVIFFWPRHRRAARVWLVALFSSYMVLGVPAVATSIAAPLAQNVTSVPLDLLKPVDVVVVFAGDNVDGRVAESVRAWRELSPRLVIVSGEEWFIRRLTKAGIPSEHMTVDGTSATTREQVDYLAAYLGKSRLRRAVVIASRLQTPRVTALLRERDLPVPVIPAPLDGVVASAGWRRLLPTYAALCVSRDALYERAALAYYRWRGWTT